MKISYKKENTHIEDSYKAKNLNLEVMTIIRERHLRHLKSTRTFDSYVREWRGHNRLYKLHLFRKHTKDVDLEENMKPYMEIIWRVIGL